MASLNKFIATGRLCADVEVRSVGDTKVASIRLAIDDSYKSRDGTKVDRAVFVDVEAWGKQADACASYLSKGSRVAVCGKLAMDQWEDKETGQKRSKLKVRADDFGGVVFLDSMRDAAAPDQKPAQTASTSADEDSIPF